MWSNPLSYVFRLCSKLPMGGDGDSGGGRTRIDGALKAAFLKAMCDGARLDEAAAALRVTLQGLYKARKRDPQFATDWQEAYASSSEAERRPKQRRVRGGETRIVANNRRGLQRRKMRHVRFDKKRQQAFLAHFCWSCDTIAAAAAAGVCERTVYVHRRKNPAFAAEFQEALEQGDVSLEAEALRQRLAVQRRLRAAIEEARPDEAGAVPADIAAEFERVLKLLDRWDRKGRRPEQSASGGARRVWTFDAAIDLLGKRLDSLGVDVPSLPPEEAARYDGPEDGEPGP